MKLMEYLVKNEEMVALRAEWKSKTDEAFPPFNTDEYRGIDDYKEKIKETLKAL